MGKFRFFGEVIVGTIRLFKKDMKKIKGVVRLEIEYSFPDFGTEKVNKETEKEILSDVKEAFKYDIAPITISIEGESGDTYDEVEIPLKINYSDIRRHLVSKQKTA